MATVKLADGSEVFCREWVPGQANGEAVLLLHGVESHSGWFDEVAPLLTRAGFAVFAYDRPGWGQSAGVPGHLFSYADELARLEALARALRLKHSRLHLAGMSWGGMFAAYAALRAGVLFDSVTLIAPGICAREGVGAFGALKAAGAVLTRDWLATVPLDINAAHFTTRPEKQAEIMADPHRTKRVSAAFCFETLKMRRFIREHAGKRALPPTSLLLAEHDQIIDNTATLELFAGAREVTSEEVARAAHSLVFEAPEKCAAAIALAAARAESRAPGRKVAVLGAGAVGSFVGGMLALGGARVTLVAREKQVAAVNRDGLKLRVGGAERIVKDNLRAVTELDEAPELLLITVKSFSLEAALAGLQGKIGRDTVIVSLQNGIGNELKIRTAFPDNRVYAGVICAYLDFPEPGTVVCADDRIGLGVGSFDGDAAGLEEVADWLRASRMEVATAVDGLALKWSKLLLNVAFNALNAVTGLATDRIMADKRYGRLAARALKEAFAVMRAEGIRPVDLPGYPVKTLEKICRLPVPLVARALAFGTRKATRAVSSMQQDLRRGRGLTEIDELNGVIVRLAENHGLDAAANRELCALVREKCAVGA